MSEHPSARGPANLVLVGYRGTGKTTIAKSLAARLGRDWVDADAFVEQRAGRTIQEIFAEDGEAAFRDLEERAIAELMAQRGLVIASGGGVILRETNRNALSGGVVVWLTAPPDVLFERIYNDPTTSERRPNLTASGGLEEIKEVLSQRLPLYRQVANYQVDTQVESPDQLANRIVSLLESAQGEG